MSTTLKISRKMAELLRAELAADGETLALIDAEHEAGTADKSGAVIIEVPQQVAALLAGLALGSIHRLDAELTTAAPENKHKLLGAHSAWRSLSRQLPQFAVPDPAA